MAKVGVPGEGLILYHVFYDGRPLFRSLRLAEMVVPYGDISPDHVFQNAFDVGEYGVGWLANSLELGCDCLGEIHYFDAHLTENDGSARTIKNAVCMHEEDDGILWKHWNYRTDHTEVRRSRRLVVSFIATIGIYEYGFFWYFRQDGSIEMDVKLSGIMNIGVVLPGVTPEYGELLNADGLYAPIHQHFFSFRVEPMIDGLQNSVVETNILAEESKEKNRWGNAFKAVNTLLHTEAEAQRDIERDGLCLAHQGEIAVDTPVRCVGLPKRCRDEGRPGVPSGLQELVPCELSCKSRNRRLD